VGQSRHVPQHHALYIRRTATAAPSRRVEGERGSGLSADAPIAVAG
jgi:hypothetical protein